MRWLAAVALLLLAGCASPAQPRADAADAAPLVLPDDPGMDWDLRDCHTIVWSIPVPAAALSGRLPQGFTPEPASLPAGIDQAASIGLQAVECSAGFGLSERAVRSVHYGRIYTPVLPPASAKDERFGTQHAYVFATLVGPDDVRRALQALGLAVSDGGVLLQPDLQGWNAGLAVDGVGAFTLAGRQMDDEVAAQPQPLRDFLPLGDGLAAWTGTATNQTVSSGVGIWQAPTGSWLAQVTGLTQGPATMQRGHFSILDGHVAPLPGAKPAAPPRDEWFWS